MRPSDRLVAAEFAGNRSILSGSVATMVRPCCPERSFKTRAFGAVMKVKPMGMLWMMPAGWSDHLARADRWAQKGLPEGRLVARMRKFTLLDDAVRGFRAVPAEGWVGEAGRRQRLVGIHDPGGERRRLFGVGEGPAEAAAGAKQMRTHVQSLISIWQTFLGQAGGGLFLSGWVRTMLGPVLQASAITRRAPKCVPDMYVWPSVDLRLIYA